MIIQKNLASAFHVSWQLLNGSPPILAVKISDIPTLRGGRHFDPLWTVEEISHGLKYWLSSAWPSKTQRLDTTRPPRPGEVDGAVGNYYFVDKEEMEKQQKMGYFFEVGVHNNNLYG